MAQYNEMTFDHDYARRKKKLRVVYIEYQGRHIHEVTCDWQDEDGTWSECMCHFDFEKDCKGIEKFMFYYSGGGGKISEIQAPHYAFVDSKATYWMHPDAKHKGKPRNIVRRDKPIKFEGDPNPFNHGREIYGINYCKFCNKWYDQDACPAHHVVNDDGELEYFDGTKPE